MRREQVSVKKERKIFTMGQRIGKWCIFLFICFLISSCPNGSEAEKNSSDFYPLPPGMGAFTLRLADSAGRTIMPASPTLSDFAVFNLNFEPTDDTPAAAAVNEDRINTGAVLAPVILAVGTYKLTVSAYNTTPKADAHLVAQQETSITIKPGSDNAETVELKPLLSGNGSNNGTFNWNITIVTGVTAVNSATMTIKNSAGQTQGAVVDLSSTSTGTRSLAPGRYTVEFNLAGREGTDKDKTVEWNELMYVYATLTSIFTYKFTEDHFSRTHWNVTLDYDSKANAGDTYHDNIDTVKMSLMHGDNINNPVPIHDPEKRGYRFDGWFTDEECTETKKWDLNNPIYQDMYLWAGWTPNKYNLTLSFDPITNPMEGESFPEITISRGKTTPVTYPITVTLTVTGTYDSISWEIEGVGNYPKISGTDSPIELNGATLNYNTLGGHVLKLKVTKSEKTWLKNIPFTVVN